METKYKQLKKILNEKKGDNLELGTIKNSPSREMVKKTEEQLGIKLPKSYLWFLENYGYASIFGEDVYSITSQNYSIPSDDIMYHYLINLENKLIENYEIPIYTDEFGQLYVMDTSKQNDNGEYPIFIKYSENGEDKKIYANDFLEFLEKQIKDIE